MKNRIIGVIQWLYVETVQGGHIRYLHPGEAPRAVFELGDETPVAVYAYCNLHGLWTTKLCYNNKSPPRRYPESEIRVCTEGTYCYSRTSLVCSIICR